MFFNTRVGAKGVGVIIFEPHYLPPGIIFNAREGGGGWAIPSQWAGIIFNTCVEERGVVVIYLPHHHRQVLFLIPVKEGVFILNRQVLFLIPVLLIYLVMVKEE